MIEPMLYAGSGRSPIRCASAEQRGALDRAAAHRRCARHPEGSARARRRASRARARKRARAGRGAAARSTRGSSRSSRSSRSSTRRTTRRARTSSRGCGIRCSTSSRRSSRRTTRRAEGGIPARRQQALARDPAVGAGAPRALPRASTASSGCSATATGFPRSGASSTSSTSSRACAAGSASSWCSASARSRKPGVSFEQEYLKTLLLMRLDSGNFTPDQVEWVAQPARGLDADADAHRRRRAKARGVLRRPDRRAGAAPARQAAQSGGRMLLSRRRARCTRASSSGCAGCRSRTTTCRSRATCPPREQRLLLMRLASLFGPDAIAHAPRARALRSRRRGARRRRACRR